MNWFSIIAATLVLLFLLFLLWLEHTTDRAYRDWLNREKQARHIQTGPNTWRVEYP